MFSASVSASWRVRCAPSRRRVRLSRRQTSTLPASRGGACAHDTIVSLLFLHDGDPVLLSEIGVGGASLKKIALTSTNFRWVQVGSDPAIWISGHEHVVVFPRRPLLTFMVRGVSIVVSLAEEATSRVRAVLDTACRPQPACVQGEMRPE